MAQITKVIDVTKSFIPIDPKAFPENLQFTEGIRDAFADKPVVAYEGYNFLPTAYGYKSYFGLNSVLGIDQLTSNIDKVFIVQDSTFKNIAVALCDDGIWTKVADTSGAWTHAITLTIPDVGKHLNWTYCNLGNTVFMYRAGEAQYWKMQPDAVYSASALLPSAVIGLTVTAYTMAGKFAAGTYTYSVAYKDASGTLSAPCAAVINTTALASIFIITFTRVTAATNGYRIYRTVGGVTTYQDIPQPASGDPAFSDDPSNPSQFVLATPEVALQYASYQPIPITPTILNMAGQMGVFKAGIRLGFWDSQNSTAWSSIDDFGDFTPSVTTLAGSAIFEEIKGRIVQILSHAEGFIIYSTKSILYIRQDLTATFQWDPVVLLGTSGIAFPEECCSGNPDTLQFASTSSGLFKIEKGQAENIIPEVVDYLRDYNQPLYLNVLEGRYLTIGILDPNYINGLVDFRTEIVPALTVTFPGGTSTGDLIPSSEISGTHICGIADMLNNGNTTEQQAAGAAAATAAGQPPAAAGTLYQPQYTAYLSTGGAIDPSSITWGPTPCATLDANGVEVNMCPAGSVGLVSQLSNDTTHKTAVTGADAYIDGHWTMERFVATQEAIWESEESNRQAFIQAILDRSSSTSKVTANSTSCVASGPTTNTCNLGEYVNSSSGRKFGYNGCSFWLTRYFTSAIDINRIRTDQTSCDNLELSYVIRYSVTYSNGAQGDFASLGEVLSSGAGWTILGTFVDPTLLEGFFYEIESADHGVTGNVAAYAKYSDGVAYQGPPPPFHSGTLDTQTYSVNAYNQGKVVDIAPIADTGVCVLTGWKYTDANGNVHTVAAAGGCAAPSDGTRPTNGSDLIPLPIANGVGGDGTFCSIPFTPVPVAGYTPNPIVWPSTSVTLPPSSFLLQDGSTGPIYPTVAGALFYDLFLKKWGKMKQNYRCLIDYSPINTSAGAIIDYSAFGVEAGLVSDGYIYRFDDQPYDSYIKYGKLGYFRKGMTAHEVVRVDFRSPSTGAIEVETSLDGRSIDPALSISSLISGVETAIIGGKYSGKWHSITVRGNYDIQYMEFTGFAHSNR